MPHRLAGDTDPVIITRTLNGWADRNEVQGEFSRPAKPTDNAFAQSFHARFRNEGLAQP